MSDCRFGVLPVNYPDPDPEPLSSGYILSPNKTQAFENSNSILFHAQD